MKTATRSCSFRSSRLQTGLTAVEVTASLGIIAIGLTLATPIMQREIIQNRVSSSISALVAGLNQARSSAITSGHSITICPSADSINCTKDSWASGWIVFSDTNKNDAADAAEIIHANDLEGSLTTDGYQQSIVFQPDGTTRLPADVKISVCFRKTDNQNLCSSVSVRTHGQTHLHSQAPS